MINFEQWQALVRTHYPRAEFHEETDDSCRSDHLEVGDWGAYAEPESADCVGVYLMEGSASVRVDGAWVRHETVLGN